MTDAGKALEAAHAAGLDAHWRGLNTEALARAAILAFNKAMPDGYAAVPQYTKWTPSRIAAAIDAGTKGAT